MQAGFGTPFAARSQRIEQRGGFRGFAIIPPTPLGVPYVTPGDPLGIFCGLLGDPLGTPWGPLGTPWRPLGDFLGPSRDSLGTLGNPLGTFGNPLGIPWGSSGTSWGSLESPRQPFGDHFGVLLDTLGTSSRLFGVNLELQRPLIGLQRSPGRVFGGILGAFWRLRKRSRSDLLQYAKTFKFIIRYCKNRCPGRLKSLKINFKNTENRRLNNVRSKSDTGAAKMTPGRSQ